MFLTFFAAFWKVFHSVVFGGFFPPFFGDLRCCGLWAFLDFYHEAAGVSCFKRDPRKSPLCWTGFVWEFKRMVDFTVFFHFLFFQTLSCSSCLSGFGIEILNNIVFEAKYLMMHMLFDLFFSSFVTGKHGPPGGLPDNIWRWKYDRPMHVPWLWKESTSFSTRRTLIFFEASLLKISKNGSMTWV